MSITRMLPDIFVIGADGEMRARCAPSAISATACRRADDAVLMFMSRQLMRQESKRMRAHASGNGVPLTTTTRATRSRYDDGHGRLFQRATLTHDAHNTNAAKHADDD